MNISTKISITCLVAMVSTTAIAHVLTLEDRLEGVARHYQDGYGRIPITLDATDETKFLSYEDSGSFWTYHGGDAVSEDAALAVCAIDAAGGATECEEAYEEPLLLGLEYLQSYEPDPSALKVTCDIAPAASKCTFKWASGRVSCLYCFEVGGCFPGDTCQ